MCDKEFDNSQLKDAIDSSILLIAYAARNSRHVPEALITTVFQTRDRMAAGEEIDADAETKLYMAYDKIADLAKVNVGSLKDTSPDTGERRGWSLWGKKIGRSAAERTLLVFSLCTALVLIGLIALQGYAFITGQIVAELNDRAQIETLPEEKRDTAIETDNIEDEAALQILRSWCGPFIWLGKIQIKNIQVKKVSGIDALTEAEVDNHATRVIGSFVFAVLQSYVLPLFYGCLGALTYVLRELIEETRNRTFRKESRMAYAVRVVLGIVAGLAIGWFFSGGTIKVESFSITPAALSFVAGYSVEILFSIMDKINDAFGESSKKRKS